MRIHIGAAALVIAAIIVSFAGLSTGVSADDSDPNTDGYQAHTLPVFVYVEDNDFYPQTDWRYAGVKPYGATIGYTDAEWQADVTEHACEHATATSASNRARICQIAANAKINLARSFAALTVGAHAAGSSGTSAYTIGDCNDPVTGEDRTIDAVPEGRRWHAWSSGTVCWDRNDDGDFDDAGEIGSLLMDE